MKLSKNARRILVIADILLIVGLVFGLWYYQRQAGDEDKLTEEELSRRYASTVRYKDQEASVRRRLTSLLLIGTDNFVGDKKQLHIEAHYNNNLADFLMVLVFDHENKTVTPFQICRDTMCEVPWISVNGITDGTEFQQITFAHMYGSGKEDSCRNTVTAVSDLLCGVPIDDYFAFTMDAIPVLNDLVGGVTVTLEDNIPALGPEYVRDAQITLKGNASLRFVRYRDTELLDSNLTRMGHHRLYVTCFANAAKEAMQRDSDLPTKAFRSVETFICTDLSVESVSDIADHLMNYELLPAVTPEGQYTEGAEFAEYYVDEDSLWACVKSVFCS